MRITLRQLRYLDALAAEGHFGRAADRAAVSQPALSAQIRELEEALGCQLVERAATGARLTAAGVAVVERGRRILAEYNHPLVTIEETMDGGARKAAELAAAAK